MYDFNTGAVIAGSQARLDRGANLIRARIETRSLPAKHIVAAFVAVFNAPENCNAPTPFGQCSDLDFENAAAEVSLLWLDGNYVTKTRTADLRNVVRKGVAGAPGEVVFGNGLQDAAGAEIHLVIFDKGEPIPGRALEQRNTFDGGCDVAACAPLQFVIFP